MPNTINTDILFKQPEFLLLWKSMLYSSEEPSQDIHIPGHDINWPYLLAIAEHHGLTPLLYLFLEARNHSVPDAILSQLRDRYNANALRNRILTKELIDILNLFNANDITALAYKGPALTLQAYDDLNHRQFGDLDILINEKHVHKACELLKQRHYHRSTPDLTPTQEKDFIRTDHEHEFISPDQLVHIDLHWSLSSRRFPFKLKTDELFERTQYCLWQDSYISHIAAQDMLLLLCMHANKDLWRKLVWICDIDRLVRKHEDIDWDLLVQQAKHAHCEKIVYIALRITYDILKTPIPDKVLNSASHLAPIKQGEKALQLSMNDSGPVKTYLQCLAIQPYILTTCDNWRDLFYYIARTLITPTEGDMMKLRIPSTMHFLYYVITPIRKISFCTTRSIKRLIFNRAQ